MLLRRAPDLVHNVPKVMTEPYVVIKFKTQTSRKGMVRCWSERGVDIISRKPNAKIPDSWR